MTAAPSMLTRKVIVDGLRYILLGGLRLPHSHQPQPNHAIAPDFIGICVATNADPATDAYVLAQLQALGVTRVRVDISDDAARVHQARLLARLSEAKIAVVLHLVQPLAAAKQMPAPAVAEAWQRFVADTLDQFASQIVAVEIGNTINRKKWAGYTMPGFLSAWEIAYRLAKSRNLQVIGPNIQDFEPLYNVAVLNTLAQAQQLPDMQSNNLFVERVIQPELNDFRILKYRWTRCLRYNLIKKARLLQKIGAERGVPALVSSVAFWAIYRIQRQLPDGAQKQADYLTRYFTLLAASGAVQHANWGAMICQREGLIDDGLPDAAYPALERVAYYAAADGMLDDYRAQPSFLAFKTIRYWLNGAQYIGAIATGHGLEIHHIRHHQREVHIAWTLNSETVLLDRVYQPQSLAAAQMYHRDGEPLTHRQILNETPIYLTWPANTQVACQPQTPALSGTLIHAHVPDLDYFPVAEGDWQGMLLAKNAAEAQQLWQAWHPSGLMPPAKKEALRHARNAIWSIVDPRQAAANVTVKKPMTMHRHKVWLDRFKPSKAKRSWNGAMELLRRGIGTAMPVAFFEHRADPSLRKNFYICDFVQHDFAISQAFSAFKQGEQSFHGITAEALYQAFAAFCVHMHGAGIFFRDFSGGNILVQHQPEGLRFVLIDTARLHASPKSVPLKYRLADLTRALNKLHWHGRRRFLHLYFELSELQPKPRVFWPFYLYDFKVSLKRTIGRKGMRNALRKIKACLGMAPD